MSQSEITQLLEAGTLQHVRDPALPKSKAQSAVDACLLHCNPVPITNISIYFALRCIATLGAHCGTNHPVCCTVTADGSAPALPCMHCSIWSSMRRPGSRLHATTTRFHGNPATIHCKNGAMDCCVGRHPLQKATGEEPQGQSGVCGNETRHGHAG